MVLPGLRGEGTRTPGRAGLLPAPLGRSGRLGRHGLIFAGFPKGIESPRLDDLRCRLCADNSKSPKKCVSSFSGKDVPCRDGNSWWSNARDCYVSLADPQPAKSDPEWEGHKTGAIYECYSPALVGSRMYTFWSATPPAGPAAPPDPRAVALQAIATMRLRAIGVGIVPEPQPGSIGIVGLPTWMWVADPRQHTWGPITRTASS